MIDTDQRVIWLTCVREGCTRLRYLPPQGKCRSECLPHFQETNRLGASRRRSTPEGRETDNARRRRGARWGSHRAARLRRERLKGATVQWVRMDPWPTICCICHRDIDPAERHGRLEDGVKTLNPLAESLGHEPPIKWVTDNPDFGGPYILRPEHWGCNASKGARPDWLMVA